MTNFELFIKGFDARLQAAGWALPSLRALKEDIDEMKIALNETRAAYASIARKTALVHQKQKTLKAQRQSLIEMRQQVIDRISKIKSEQRKVNKLDNSISHYRAFYELARSGLDADVFHDIDEEAKKRRLLGQVSISDLNM